jgi:hypothetical protein
MTAALVQLNDPQVPMDGMGDLWQLPLPQLTPCDCHKDNRKHHHLPPPLDPARIIATGNGGSCGNRGNGINDFGGRVTMMPLRNEDSIYNYSSFFSDASTNALLVFY